MLHVCGGREAADRQMDGQRRTNGRMGKDGEKKARGDCGGSEDGRWFQTPWMD